MTLKKSNVLETGFLMLVVPKSQSKLGRTRSSISRAPVVEMSKPFLLPLLNSNVPPSSGTISLELSNLVLAVEKK
jgi:hypothetical protein